MTLLSTNIRVVVIEEGILLESVALIAHWAFLEPGLAISIYIYIYVFI
jgi:hypothetical protein